MQFANIDMSVAPQVFQSASHKFKQLLLDLGLRSNNYFVGSGLGGNNFQLLVLMNMSHTLSSTYASFISFHGDDLRWNADWLASAKLEDIRKQLDQIFPQIAEHKKYLPMSTETICESMDPKMFDQHLGKFPHLQALLNGQTQDLGSSMSNLDKLLMACFLCRGLVLQLEQQNTSNVSHVGALLDKFPMEICLLAIRRFIGIEMIVKLNLDEDPMFGAVLRKINKAIDL